MLGSALSVFNESDDFRAALRESGDVDLVVTGSGRFKARLSSIALQHIHLRSCEEHLPRVAFVSLAPSLVRVTLPAEPNASLILGGIGLRAGEIATHGAGYQFHERTSGPCRWNTFWLPARHLAISGRTMRGTNLIIPHGERRWRPPPGALRSLISLHGNAIRATVARQKLPVEREAARGLEQQIILALIECLVGEA